MCYSQEPIPTVRSKWSIERHGEDTPFRHHSVIRQYIEDLFTQKGHDGLVQYNTTVERAIKDSTSQKWSLTLRRTEIHNGSPSDYWWTESFNAVVVASGHYAVPYIPAIPGLEEFAARYPGSVEHTKHYRGPQKYQDKKVITVGASVSAADTAVSIIDSAQTPVHAVVRGRYNVYFGDDAFKHPKILRRAPISHITSDDRTVHFEDGTFETRVDNIIFGTGFTWTLPFLPQVQTRNNRVPSKSSSGKLSLLPASSQVEQLCLLRRSRRRGRLVALRCEAMGEGGQGRPLPPFDQKWVDDFNAGHERRKQMWRRANTAATAKL